MEADVRGRRGHRRHRRDEILRRLGLGSVDRHVRRADLLEERECVGAMLVVEPGPMPELDEHLVAAELLLRPREVVERVVPEYDVLR